MNNIEDPAEFHIKVKGTDQKIPNLITEHSGFTIREIKSYMQKGAVWLSDKTGTHRVRRASKNLAIGDELHCYFNQIVLNATIEEPTLLEDKGQYSIWVKPNGVLSQGSKWGDHCSIARWVELYDTRQRPAFIVHRLDRAACGLMLIAHGKKMASTFSAMFAQRKISKNYIAYVEGDHSSRTAPQTINEQLDGKVSVTHIQKIDFDEKARISTFHINIETGRKHQIRKHLAGIGCHIINDRLYKPDNESAKKQDSRQYLQLFAVSLEFECPIDGSLQRFQLPEGFLPNHSALITASKIIEPPVTV